jgi:hypothetical protein
MHVVSEFDSVMRPVAAVGFVAMGLAMLRWPESVWDLSAYFRSPAAKMPPFDRLRLTRVIVARENAERISNGYGRYLGITAILLAGVALLPPVLLIVPYLLLCLGFAVATLFAYLRFSRAAQRRAAPLVRRSPLEVVSPFVAASVACSLGIILTLLIYPHLRLGASIVAASMIILAFVAWRVAGAPALLLGADPQFECVVDERLRAARVNRIAGLACASGYLFTGVSGVTAPDFNGFFLAGKMVVWAAFMATIFANIVLARKRIRIT